MSTCSFLAFPLSETAKLPDFTFRRPHWRFRKEVRKKMANRKERGGEKRFIMALSSSPLEKRVSSLGAVGLKEREGSKMAILLLSLPPARSDMPLTLKCTFPHHTPRHAKKKEIQKK